MTEVQGIGAAVKGVAAVVPPQPTEVAPPALVAVGGRARCVLEPEVAAALAAALAEGPRGEERELTLAGSA